MGQYDAPAMIDHVLRSTGAEKLHYLAFSMSTTSFLTGMSLRPEYNEKIRTAILMGPGAYQDNFINGYAKLIAFTATIGTVI
jgi:pimeloyl-ACP methyl ester carboxylesterase